KPIQNLQRRPSGLRNVSVIDATISARAVSFCQVGSSPSNAIEDDTATTGASSVAIAATDAGSLLTSVVHKA
ncbi:MAG: hypothetical protein AAFP68_10495, partial [Pseudomonadota bacterium]